MVLGVVVLAAPTAAADPSPGPPDHPQPLTAGLYLATGDLIDGWTWLRDDAGCAYATWSFFGRPDAPSVLVTLNLLATDAVNGGPGVDGHAWIAIGPIVAGAPGPAAYGPVPIELTNVSPPDDPVGYLTEANVALRPEELGPDATGLWVLVERRGPTGTVVPGHIATTREAVTVDGLEPIATPAASPAG
jgi:hypothetical protein